MERLESLIVVILDLLLSPWVAALVMGIVIFRIRAALSRIETQVDRLVADADRATAAGGAKRRVVLHTSAAASHAPAALQCPWCGVRLDASGIAAGPQVCGACGRKFEAQ